MLDYLWEQFILFFGPRLALNYTYAGVHNSSSTGETVATLQPWVSNNASETHTYPIQVKGS